MSIDKIRAAIGNAPGGRPSNIAAAKEALAALAELETERDKYWGALHSTKDELFECRARLRGLESELRITRDQRDQLRARLAAIDEAPTVAKVCLSVMQDRYYVVEEVDESDLPRLGTELIARPEAK